MHDPFYTIPSTTYYLSNSRKEMIDIHFNGFL